MAKLDALTQLIFRRRQMAERRELPNRGKKIPKWQHPITVELEYNKILQRYVAAMNEVIEAVLIPAIPSLLEQRNLEIPEAARSDAWPEDAERLMGSVRQGFDKIPVNMPADVSEIANKTNVWNDKQWRNILESTFGVDIFQREPWLNETLNSWSKENAALITKMTDDHISQVEGVVQRGVRGGVSAKRLTGEVMERTGVTKNRAKLIARDQVSKLNGQLTELRQTNIGVKKYIWRDSDDKRVRQTHAANDGRTFSWNKAPMATGHPGEDYQCRCWAEPIFDEIMDELSLQKQAPVSLPSRGVTKSYKTKASAQSQKSRIGNINSVITYNSKTGKWDLTIPPLKKAKAVPRKVKPTVKAPTKKAPTGNVLVDYENDIRFQKNETSTVFSSKNNKKLSEIHGERTNKVYVSNEQFDLMKNNISVHNHPDFGGSFSPADLDTAFRSDVLQARVTSKQFLYTIDRKERTWIRAAQERLKRKVPFSDIDDIVEDLEKMQKVWKASYRKDFVAGRLSKQDYHSAWTHAAMKQHAKKYGYIYKRTKYADVVVKEIKVPKIKAAPKPKVAPKPKPVKAPKIERALTELKVKEAPINVEELHADAVKFSKTMKRTKTFDSLEGYLDVDYGKINNYLADRVTVNKYGEKVIADQKIAKTRIKDLDRIFKMNYPKYDGTVYRGLSFGNKFDDTENYRRALESFKTDSIIKFPEYVSTSRDLTGVENFTKKSRKIVLRIKGKNGLYVDTAYGRFMEKEVLFNRDTEFKVGKIIKRKIGGKNMIQVDLQEI